MSENRNRSAHKKIDWTPADRARHKAIREKFQAERPTLEDLLASGDYAGPLPLRDYLALRRFLHALREERERQGLSVTDVAERMGIDKAAVSRLETGRQANPTIETLCRYAAAIGKRIEMTLADAEAVSR
jgi:ribosome-binding protein aMBF1 (putative translation factor)